MIQITYATLGSSKLGKHTVLPWQELSLARIHLHWHSTLHAGLRQTVRRPFHFALRLQHPLEQVASCKGGLVDVEGGDVLTAIHFDKVTRVVLEFVPRKYQEPVQGHLVHVFRGEARGFKLLEALGQNFYLSVKDFFPPRVDQVGRTTYL